MTTIKLSGGGLGRECMYVRCDMARAESPIQVNYDMGEGWTQTQYQAADVLHGRKALIVVAKELAACGVEMPSADFDCEATEI